MCIYYEFYNYIFGAEEKRERVFLFSIRLSMGNVAPVFMYFSLVDIVSHICRGWLVLPNQETHVC